MVLACFSWRSSYDKRQQLQSAKTLQSLKWLRTEYLYNVLGGAWQIRLCNWEVCSVNQLDTRAHGRSKLRCVLWANHGCWWRHTRTPASKRGAPIFRSCLSNLQSEERGHWEKLKQVHHWTLHIAVVLYDRIFRTRIQCSSMWHFLIVMFPQVIVWQFEVIWASMVQVFAE